ncbi:hypothetical protein ACQ9ZG_09060 [Streptomyces araujoniae]|uniref:hypothetical protein n=1 Tax=Streptomyces sp. ZEA17I TaxID=2202516 RepID=UPI0015E85B01|nr:hypothetical protein [Streptomyces sp. ZEA17I]
MSKAITSLVMKVADRLLPKTEAAAGCPEYCETWWTGTVWRKCCFYANCTANCVNIG